MEDLHRRDRRGNDEQIGYLTSQVEVLAKSVEGLSRKVDELVGMKDRGLGFIISVGLGWSVISVVIVDWVKSHIRF